MISSEITLYQWALLYFLCFVDKPLLINAKSSSGTKFHYEKQRSVSKIWSSWTEWSDCSRTCGGGVRMRSRICRIRANEHESDDDSCQGEKIEHAICSTQDCSPNDKGFLEYQCSLRNGLAIAGRKISDWLPYQYRTNPCQLQCWSKGNFIVHSFGKVMDGTKCSAFNPEEVAVCINGRCSPVDCFGNIGSFKKRDKCGVCGGNNSTCIKIQNTFWRRPRSKTYYSNKDYSYEYDEIFNIPTGATNILIKEVSKNNFLALADYKGNYFINGNWRVDSPGKFNVHGSEFIYNRTWDGSEVLSSTTSTKYPLMLFVMGNGDIPTVHYEYWLSSHSSAVGAQHNLRHTDSFKHQSTPPKIRQMDTNTIPTSASKPTTVLTKPQGYNSFYHRNEILKSVPSWSIKRFSSYKNPLNILSYQNPNYIYSVDESATTEDSSNVQKSMAVFKNHTTDDRFVQSSGRFNGTRSNTWTNEIVSLDNTGRPTGTSAQTRPNNQLLKYDVQEEKERMGNNSKALEIRNYRKDKLQNMKDIKPKDKKRTRNKRRRKSNKENCSPCPKVKHQTKNFCQSDFVLRAVVLSAEKHQGSTRFEMEIIQSFKNKIPIMPREYIWSPSTECQCPKLGFGREIIIMGNMKTFGNQRESRLVVDENSFIRKYTQKRARTMLRLIRDKNSLCKKY